MKWIEVTVGVLAGQVDLAGDALLQCCPRGFADLAAPGGRRRMLRGYVPTGGSGRAGLTRLRRNLRRIVSPFAMHTRVVDDADWIQAWKAHARPIRVGRLIVMPTWMHVRRARGHPAKGESRATVVIHLDPGMAFGSGEHPTTQLCLAAIEQHVRAADTVIDVGTGSGILAIAAARLGARRVLAIDNDPAAVTVARANTRANDVGDRVIVRQANGFDAVRLRADLIAANLTADSLPAIFRGARRCLAPGARLVASGFSGTRVKDVVRAIEAAGLRATGVQRLRGWCLVHAVAASRHGTDRAGRRRGRSP